MLVSTLIIANDLAAVEILEATTPIWMIYRHAATMLPVGRFRVLDFVHVAGMANAPPCRVVAFAVFE